MVQSQYYDYKYPSIMARSQWKERTHAWFAEPEGFEELLDHLADGGTLAEYTTKEQIKYLMVLEWINADPEREKRYELALAARASQMEDKVLASLRDAAQIDPRDLFDDGGNLKDIKEMPDREASSLTSFEVVVDKDGIATNRVKFTPRHTANQDLGKHLGMFKERIDVNDQTGKEPDNAPSLENARRVAFLLNKAAKVKTGEDNVSTT